MKYKILDSKFQIGKLNLEVVLEPKNQVLDSFFWAINIKTMYDFLDKLYKKESYYQSPMSVKFFKDLDWEQLEDIKEEVGEVKEDDIVLYYELDGDFVINSKVFIKMILDYSEKLIEVYRNNDELGEEWLNKMELNILKLRGKRNQ